MLSSLRVSMKAAFVFLIIFTSAIFGTGYYFYGQESTKTDDRSVYQFKSDLLKERLQNNPDDEPLQLELALAQYLEGKSADSLRTYNDILKKDSLNPAALLYAGIINLDMKRHQEAIRYLEKVVFLKPGFQPQLLYPNLGKAYFDSGNYAKAIRNLKTAAVVSPGSVEANYYLGLSYQRTGQYEEARMALEKVVQIDKVSETGKQAKKILESLYKHTNG